MNGQDRLTGALKAIAAETAPDAASPRVRSALLREVRRRRLRKAAPWWLAAAAALAIGVWMGVSTRQERPAVPGLASTPSAAEVLQTQQVAPPVLESAPAVSTPSAVTVRRAAPARDAAAVRLAATPWMVHQTLPPVERGQVLRLPVSPELARQFGVPQQSGEWQAEIFMGDDGLARAFRLVRIPAYK